MPKKMEELEAMLVRETHRFGETTVLLRCVKSEDAEEYAKREDAAKSLRASNFISHFSDDREDMEKTVKTEAEEGEMEAGITYRFYGSWSKHWRYGWQFHAKTWTKITPHDRIGVINYLMRAPGIGKVRAEKLWKAYGGDAVKKVREDPVGAAAAIAGKQSVPMEQRFKEAAAYLEEQKNLEDATISVVSLLAGRGFPKKLAKEVIKKYGNTAAELIRKNPYLLMKFRGVGFARADDMYLDLGGRPDRMKRQTLAIWHGIESASDGHTWFGTHFVEATLREKLASATADPIRAIKLGLRAGLLSMHRDESGAPWFSTNKMSADESFIAAKLAFLSTRESVWPKTESGLSDHQIEQLTVATSKPIGIFAGNPGTGKSYTAARLVSRLAQLCGYEEIAIVAPTGKAAVRVTEAMQECGVNVRAKTVHSLLKVASAEDGWSFEHNETNPLEERYVIVDESSMLDTPIMSSLVKALRDDGHLMLIGDLQQLPPVGHGAPLRDLLTAGIPFGNLTEIRRNSGEIVRTCAKIRDQQGFSLADRLDPDVGLNLCIKRCADADAAAQIERLVGAARDRQICDAVWELQVIVALNEKSQVSRAVLNKSLQADLNSKNRQKTRFWPQDKIVCLRNQMLPVDLDLMESVTDDLEGMVGETASGDAAAYIANGEIGKVIAVYPNRLVLEFFSPRRIVTLPKGEGADAVEGFDLGYAISCHKSQGSQWKMVIVALDPSGGARRVCDRSWIYTAISRAKDACILVGKDDTMRRMCREQKIDKRKTFLVERLTAYVRANYLKEKECSPSKTSTQTDAVGSSSSGEETENRSGAST